MFFTCSAGSGTFFTMIVLMRFTLLCTLSADLHTDFDQIDGPWLRTKEKPGCKITEISTGEGCPDTGRQHGHSPFPQALGCTGHCSRFTLSQCCYQFFFSIHSLLSSNFIFFIFMALVYLLSRSEEHTSELQSRGHLVCRLLLEKKK